MTLDPACLLAHDGLVLDHFDFDGDGKLLAELHGEALHPACPQCGTPAQGQHSRYTRTLADFPCLSHGVQLRLRVRRCFCPNAECQQVIFAERFPALTERYARRTSRLTRVLRTLALSAGGRAGARLAAACSMNLGRKALLTLIRRSALPERPTPRVLGVDDWALRKGHTYGTILIDHEAGRVLDLLPDRSSESLAKWLREHPGVQVITRDRANVYAEGIRQGAPEAEQVADRWHLLKNLGETVQRVLLSHQREVKAALREVAADIEVEGELALKPGAPPPQEQPPVVSDRKQAQYDQVQQLHLQGVSIRALARELDLCRNTVKKYLRADTCPEPQPRHKSSRFEADKPYLLERWNAGCRNARQVWQELREQGFQGGYSGVKSFFTGLRRQHGMKTRQHNSSPARSPGFPAARRLSLATLAWTMTKAPEQRQDHDQAHLDRLRSAHPDLGTTIRLAEQFAVMVRRRDPSQLGTWLRSALESGIAALKGFAQGVWNDLDAGREGLRQKWSNGRTEGFVNKLKTVKRQMYGRAKFDLLRARLLAASS